MTSDVSAVGSNVVSNYLTESGCIGSTFFPSSIRGFDQPSSYRWTIRVDNTALAAVVSLAHHKIYLARWSVLTNKARRQPTLGTTRTIIRQAC